MRRKAARGSLLQLQGLYVLPLGLVLILNDEEGNGVLMSLPGVQPALMC